MLCYPTRIRRNDEASGGFHAKEKCNFADAIANEKSQDCVKGLVIVPLNDCVGHRGAGRGLLLKSSIAVNGRLCVDAAGRRAKKEIFCQGGIIIS